MGLPCPNLFTGEMGIHSKQEYVSVQDMEKAVETLVHLAGYGRRRPVDNLTIRSLKMVVILYFIFNIYFF